MSIKKQNKLDYLLMVVNDVFDSYIRQSSCVSLPESLLAKQELKLIDDFRLYLALIESDFDCKLNFKAKGCPWIYSLEFGVRDQVLHTIHAHTILPVVPKLEDFHRFALMFILARELCERRNIYPSKRQIEEVKQAIQRDKKVKLVDILKILYKDQWEPAIKRLILYIAVKYVISASFNM